MFVYYIQTAKDIVKLFSRPDSPIILVSWGHLLLPNSKGYPSAGELITRQWEKFAILSEFVYAILQDNVLKTSGEVDSFKPWNICF